MPLLSIISKITSSVFSAKRAETQNISGAAGRSTKHGRDTAKDPMAVASSVDKVITGRVSKKTKIKTAAIREENLRNKRSESYSLSSAETPSYEGTTMLEEESTSSLNANDDTLLDGQSDTMKLPANDSRLQAHLLEGWSADEIWIKEKFNKRGNEPLLPELWHWDFESFPDVLFTNIDERAFIQNLYTPITEGVDEFAALVDNGARCRDLSDQGREPEFSLAKGIQRFKKWSLRDAKLHTKQYLDCTIICDAKAGESASYVTNRAKDRLKMLGKEWRDKFQHLVAEKHHLITQNATPLIPTLYAFVVKYSVVSILSYDANMQHASVRLLELLNHGLVGQDVWHAFAIGIVCVHARNRLLELQSRGVFDELHQSIEDADA